MSDIMVMDDFNNQNETKHNINTKIRPPRKMIIGVIGLKETIRHPVKKLTESGHVVNIWCPSHRKSIRGKPGDNFKTHLSARAVLKSSDVVFNYVSDHEVAKKIITNDFGMRNDMETLLRGKGFVEMSSVDPGTSVEMKGMIEAKGGKYLEAQLQRSRLGGNEGKLVILAAGNKLLFEECQACFDAISMAGDALYYGEVGYATTMNLVLQQMKGVCLAALTEGLALANSFGIRHKDLLDILNSTTGICSSYMQGNANVIVGKHLTVEKQSIRMMQNDLNSTLSLSRYVGQSMFVTATASEILKRCQSYGYEEYDVSTIHRFHR